MLNHSGGKADVFELSKEMLEVDKNLDVDYDTAQEITAYIETWFDVDKKFGLHILDEDGTWLNMYAIYNPFADTLRIECEISRPDSSEYFDYKPTANEEQLIKNMLAETIRQEYGQTPQEFCDEVGGKNSKQATEEITMVDDAFGDAPTSPKPPRGPHL